MSTIHHKTIRLTVEVELSVIKEKTVVEKPAQPAQPVKEEKKSESEDAPW